MQRSIREARIRAGLSQAELGQKLGVSQGAVYSWEKKGRIPEKYAAELDRILESKVPREGYDEPSSSATETSVMENIREARSRLQLSQAELGQKLGVSRSAVWSWEKKGRVPKKSRARLSEILGGEYSTGSASEEPLADGRPAKAGETRTPELVNAVDSPILSEILNFFRNVFVVETRDDGYKFAAYSRGWLRDLGIPRSDSEKATVRTTHRLQDYLERRFGERVLKEARVKTEGPSGRVGREGFDILDQQADTAFEISLSDAFAEFFKDVLKALLDSRVKRLYFCMRNHDYKNARASGYIKVASSPLVQQCIVFARKHQLDVQLVDLLPQCNR